MNGLHDKNRRSGFLVERDDVAPHEFGAGEYFCASVEVFDLIMLLRN